MTTPTAATMTGGEALVRALAAHGVDTVFGIPGTHNLAVFAAMPAHGIRNVTPRHEQGAGYAADGYSRASGRVGVVITTTGPAALNAAAALAQANSDSVPTLLIAPGMPTGHPSHGNGLLHELKNQRAVFSGLVAESHRVESLQEIPGAVAQAFARMTAGRPRSEYLEVPLDLLDAVGEIALVAPVPAPAPLTPAAAELESARALLDGAERVLLVVGGGARGATGEVQALAEKLGAGVATTTNGKGNFDERHPLALGAGLQHPSIVAAAESADAVIAVGTEFAPSDWWIGVPDCAAKLVRVDIDPAAVVTNITPSVALVGDAAATLAALTETVAERGRSGAAAAWFERALVGAREERAAEGGTWLAAMQSLAEALPDDAIIAADNAMVAYYGALGQLRLRRPNAFMFPTGVGTLGFGLPAGIGAKLAQPDAPVVVIQGDGGIMFTVQELATAAELGIALPVIISDNGGYGEIRNEMADRDEPIHSVALGGPDFVQLGQALGCHGVRVDRDEQLGEAVREALAADRPTVIHLREGGRAAADMLASRDA
ncbi:MAG: thiamine pyrophosphate-binding protein [Microbacteriaceae bacterium]